MKTFKQHVKEDHGSMGVGTSDQNAIEDGSIGVHNVHDPDVLSRVNIFVKSMSMKEYLSPDHAITELRNKLMRIGLNFGPVGFDENNQWLQQILLEITRKLVGNNHPLGQ